MFNIQYAVALANLYGYAPLTVILEYYKEHIDEKSTLDDLNQAIRLDALALKRQHICVQKNALVKTLLIENNAVEALLAYIKDNDITYYKPSLIEINFFMDEKNIPKTPQYDALYAWIKNFKQLKDTAVIDTYIVNMAMSIQMQWHSGFNLDISGMLDIGRKQLTGEKLKALFFLYQDFQSTLNQWVLGGHIPPKMTDIESSVFSDFFDAFMQELDTMDFRDLESIEEAIKSGIFGQMLEETINQAASLDDVYFDEGGFYDRNPGYSDYVVTKYYPSTSLSVQLDAQNLVTLKRIAKNNHFKGYSQFRKNELVKALTASLIQNENELINILNTLRPEVIALVEEALKCDVLDVGIDEPVLNEPNQLIDCGYMQVTQDFEGYNFTIADELKPIYKKIFKTSAFKDKRYYDIIDESVIILLMIYGFLTMQDILQLLAHTCTELTDKARTKKILKQMLENSGDYIAVEEFWLHKELMSDYLGIDIKTEMDLLKQMLQPGMTIYRNLPLKKVSLNDYERVKHEGADITEACHKCVMAMVTHIKDKFSRLQLEDELMDIYLSVMGCAKLGNDFGHLAPFFEHFNLKLSKKEKVTLKKAYDNYVNSAIIWGSRGHIMQELEVLFRDLTKNQTLSDTVIPIKKAPAIADVKISRNDPCPCGSGKKYKKCCLKKEKSLKIYRFRLGLVHYKRQIWREVELLSTDKLSTLAYLSLATFGADASHLYNLKYNGIFYENIQSAALDDLWFDKNICDITAYHLADLNLKVSDCLQIEYDFGACWEIDIVLKNVEELTDQNINDYPKFNKGRGEGIIDDEGPLSSQKPLSDFGIFDVDNENKHIKSRILQQKNAYER